MKDKTGDKHSLYEEYIEYIRLLIDRDENAGEEKYKDIKKYLKNIEQRLGGDLHVGVVGTFSSGKSTFINSIICKRFLPTDAVQGTTVATGILKKSDFNDVEIEYNDGNIVRLSECKKDLLKKYQINVESIWRKTINWITNIIYRNSKNNDSIENDSSTVLFKKIISTEEIATDVRTVTLYYNKIDLPDRISLVDTPGTESLNKRHNEVTKDAIDNICDVLVITIPYDNPVSETLLQYLNNDLAEYKENCIFVVTKVELEEIDELPRLLKVIQKRLENGAKIRSACVIPMPTYLYLKSVDTNIKTAFLEDIGEENKVKFLEMYDEGLKKFKDILELHRDEHIKSRLFNICEKLHVKLENILTDEINKYKEEQRLLESNLVISLRQFNKLSMDKIICCHNNIKQYNKEKYQLIQDYFEQLKSEVKVRMEDCKDSKELLEQLNISYIPILSKIAYSLSNYLYDIKRQCDGQLNNIKKDYYKEYDKCGIKGDIELIDFGKEKLFEESLFLEYEEDLKKNTEDIELTIRNETDGLFNKFKALLSNPLEKHKNIIITKLSEHIDNTNVGTTDFIMNRINKISDIALCNMRESVEKMTENDSKKIDEYIGGTKLGIKNIINGNNERRADIREINKYINNIREVEYGYKSRPYY